MSRVEQDAPIWTLIAQLEAEAVNAWRLKYRSSLSLEEALTQAVKTVETYVVRRRGGNVLVTVSILATKAFEGEVNVFSLQRVGNKVYKLIEPDEPSS